MTWPGKSLLHKACFEGNLDEVRRIVESGQNINNLDKDGFTAMLAPLHITAMKGHLHIARYLLSQRVEVDVRSTYQTTLDTQVNDQLTPLTYAVQRDDLRMAKLLLEAGASADIEFYNSYSDGSSVIAYSLRSNAKSPAMKELLESPPACPNN